MTKPLHVFLTAGLLASFIILFGTAIVEDAQDIYPLESELTSVSYYTDLNDSLATTTTIVDEFRTSEADQSSQINLFKNAPASMKRLVDLSIKQFQLLLHVAEDQFLPGWALALIVTIFMVAIAVLIIRLATGTTP